MRVGHIDIKQMLRPVKTSRSWSNPACMGYMMLAMAAAGMSEDDVARAGICLNEALNRYSLSEAAAIGNDAYAALQ